MNIFNDITVHAASFELESQIYFLDDFRQKRPLWQKEGEKMEEKKRKKKFFPSRELTPRHDYPCHEY